MKYLELSDPYINKLCKEYEHRVYLIEMLFEQIGDLQDENDYIWDLMATYELTKSLQKESWLLEDPINKLGV